MIIIIKSVKTPLSSPVVELSSRWRPKAKTNIHEKRKKEKIIPQGTMTFWVITLSFHDIGNLEVYLSHVQNHNKDIKLRQVKCIHDLTVWHNDSDPAFKWLYPLKQKFALKSHWKQYNIYKFSMFCELFLRQTKSKAKAKFCPHSNMSKWLT